ncbi:Asp23/Gls24 family envelope stress response protein [Kribbella sp. NPDC020789]
MTETATTKPAAKRPTVAPITGAERAGTVVADGTVADGAVAGGRTAIADVVVSKIAGIATREIPGVHALGGGAARAVGMLRERIPGSKTNLSQGVSVEVGETQAAVDIELVAEYGVSIAELAAAIRQNVISAVERMTGLEVTEVNISVTDVHLDGDDDDDESDETTEPRVR